MSNIQHDWKSQLAAISKQLKKTENKTKKQPELNEEYGDVRKFLTGYKYNSALYINNFLRRHGYKDYSQDEFCSFEYLYGVIPYHVFDNRSYSNEIEKYLSFLKQIKCAYYPIDVAMIKRIIDFAETLDNSQPFSDEIVLYRGCTTIEKNGVNAITSTTTDYNIAEKFSRGTILKIHVPAGTKALDVKSLRSKNDAKYDRENEILLPPCRYTIISKKIISKGEEPNNPNTNTVLLEISVKPLDLLDVLLCVMKKPSEEYDIVARNLEYEEALNYLKDYMRKRKIKNKSLNLKKTN